MSEKVCVVCGREFTALHGNAKRCPRCRTLPQRPKHWREVDWRRVGQILEAMESAGNVNRALIRDLRLLVDAAAEGRLIER